MFQKSPLWDPMWMIRKSIWYFQFRILKLLRLNLHKIWKELAHGAACINSLLVNPKKTKLLLLGTSQMLKRLGHRFLYNCSWRENNSTSDG